MRMESTMPSQASAMPGRISRGVRSGSGGYKTDHYSKGNYPTCEIVGPLWGLALRDERDEGQGDRRIRCAQLIRAGERGSAVLPLPDSFVQIYVADHWYAVSCEEMMRKVRWVDPSRIPPCLT
jgi:hypothetical protein